MDFCRDFPSSKLPLELLKASSEKGDRDGEKNLYFGIAFPQQENDKKNVLAVQSLRNNLMGSSLIASSSFLVCCALLAFTSTISDKRELVLTELNQVEVSHKSAVLILSFMAVFFCQTLSITFLNQLAMAINTLVLPETKVTPEQLLAMLDRGSLLSVIGNRLFFTAMPLVLWIYSPVLAFASTCAVIAVLYMTDIVPRRKRITGNAQNL